MKKIMSLFLLSLIFIFAISSVNAILDCNLTKAADSSYIASSTAFLVNTSVSVGNGENVTNITLTIRNTQFVNSTLNGTSIVNQVVSHAFPINIASITSGNSVGVFITCYNQSDSAIAASAKNSSNLTWNLDFTNPTITIQQPAQGEMVSAKGTGKVLIDYTPTDTNLGNSTYYINGVRQTSSTSATTSSNLTSGSRKNTFTKYFGTNNNSINLIVEITDLAGNKANSSTTTFNVFVQGAAEPAKVFITPSGEVISTPAQPKGKAITKTPLSFGKVGNAGSLLSNPLVWGGAIIVAVGLFIWWQNKKR